MLLWAGLGLILTGILCLGVDRAVAHAFYDRVGPRFHAFLEATTHWAKAAHWLVGAIIAYGAARWALTRWPGDPPMRWLADCSLAFIMALGAGSAILHGMKLVIGRRRPRDDFEMGLHGFRFFAFNLDHNSFPSGHSLTIFCVAVIATAVLPKLAIVWFAIAAWLALTRAMLTAHYLSDVFIGAGIGIIAARETIVYLFPALHLAWF
jgi:membrane-associated phospholipid phosphatase